MIYYIYIFMLLISSINKAKIKNMNVYLQIYKCDIVSM